MDRYTTNHEEGEVLQNLLGITDQGLLHAAEFEGFLMAEILFTERLTSDTRFTVKYIQDIHYTALHRLYSFAGKFRTVNMSKGGFVFPAARFIPESMSAFEKEFLLSLPKTYPDKASLARDIARVHGDYLNDPTPTDAITFPYGEILVSSDTAERYAAAHGLDRREELFRYLVHGLTHLQGYLDADPAERDALFAVQEPLVARYCPK